MSTSIYVPSDEENLQHVMGVSVFQSGMYPIYASWGNQDEDDYDMKTLFSTGGKLRLEEIVNISKYDFLLSPFSACSHLNLLLLLSFSDSLLQQQKTLPPPINGIPPR
jgi:hypothetical protein